MPCKFCGSALGKLHITLYGITICDKCHLILKKHDIKNELIDLEKRIQEYRNYIERVAPSKIRTYKYYYVRHGFYTERIPRYIFDKDESNAISKTEENIKQKSILYKILSICSPFSCRRLLHKKTREVIERELAESAGELRRQRLERIEEQKKKAEKQISEYVKRKILRKYPLRYRQIIETVKNEGILLYEYYLDEYPPDWEYRAKSIKERDSNSCQNCGDKTNLCVHHKIPVRRHSNSILTRHSFTEKKLEDTRLRKGDHFPDNLITLCNLCHLKEHPEIMEKLPLK
jgi:hypothetical protein